MEFLRSRSQMYAHFVWSTKRREHWLTEDLERPVYRCIEMQAQKCGCEVLAIGGMPDHVHVVLKMPLTQAASTVVKHMKGVSSTLARHAVHDLAPFQWQERYGSFSFSRRDVRAVVTYVTDQKRRHASGDLWKDLEETTEAVTVVSRQKHPDGGEQAAGHCDESAPGM